MSRVNINQASREELIEMVKQLRQQLRPNQAGYECAKELKQEVAQLKKELLEKDNTVKALTHQGAMLSEKSASDEETISVLIKQLEEFTAGGSNTAQDDGVVVARAVTTKATTSNPNQKTAAAGRAFSLPIKSSTGVGQAFAETPLGEAGGENATSAAAIIARKNEEMAKLEMKVRELTEVNTFYTAIVSHHDEEERLREVAKHVLPDEESNIGTPIDATSLHERIGVLETERDNLQRMLRHQKHEQLNLINELQALREELSRLELELVAAERWKMEEVAALSETPEPSPRARVSSTPLGDEPTPTRTLAQLVMPIQYKGTKASTSGGKLMPGRPTRTWSRSPLADAHASPNRVTPIRSLLDLEALPEIRLWNASKQEKELWERLELYRKHIEEMQAYEADRQRSFDEMERARAELFTDMNANLEEQRREIQRLKKKLAASTDVHGEAEVQKTVEPRPVSDAATSPVVAYMPCEYSNVGFSEAMSSASGKPQQLAGEAAVGADNATRGLREERNSVVDDDTSVEEALLEELVGHPFVSASNASLKYGGEGGDHSDVGANNDSHNAGEEGTLSDTEQTYQLKESSFDMDVAVKVWQLIQVEEENERLGIVCEEAEKVISALLWSRMSITTAAEEVTARAVAAVREVARLENALLEMRDSASTLEKRERELLAKAAQLQEAMASMQEVEKRRKEAEEEDTEASVTSWKAQDTSSSSLEVASARDPWGPLQCVCQAYSEVVEAQVALLRTVSATDIAAQSSEECEHVVNKLDAILIRLKDAPCKRNGTNDKGAESPYEHLGEVDVSKDMGQGCSLFEPPRAPTIATYDAAADSSKFCANSERDDVGGGDAPRREPIFGETENPKLDTSKRVLEISRTTALTPLGDRNDVPMALPEGTSMAEPLSWNTPTASFFAEGPPAGSSDDAPHLGMQPRQGFAPSPFDYFRVSQLSGEKIERGDNINEGAPIAARNNDLFAALQANGSNATTSEQEAQTFVAEFDPFA
ncbi:hypothetical protein DQ04_01621040 [Trypanosoma grayi]|uniref:hypothetical protein n=1 Tax=Trypanosoma grayi TaxID=71804 RepID=UPI0004F45BC8|nr:hypothetical protein DQ04_01621040 [Trypanosoma grayi]KEG12551.1 hypothetical protein DQ04_01621040 [Trypanosoma grayi]